MQTQKNALPELFDISKCVYDTVITKKVRSLEGLDEWRGEGSVVEPNNKKRIDRKAERSLV